MLDKIKEAIFKKYKKTDNKWLFISAFDEKNILLISSWVISSDKELEQLVETIYHWLVEKYTNISNILIDIVTETQEVTDIKAVQSISLTEFWLVLSTWAKAWILLPNTEGITDIASALKIIKEKNWLEWNANITKFKTDRFSI